MLLIRYTFNGNNIRSKLYTSLLPPLHRSYVCHRSLVVPTTSRPETGVVTRGVSVTEASNKWRRRSRHTYLQLLSELSFLSRLHSSLKTKSTHWWEWCRLKFHGYIHGGNHLLSPSSYDDRRWSRGSFCRLSPSVKTYLLTFSVLLSFGQTMTENRGGGGRRTGVLTSVPVRGERLLWERKKIEEISKVLLWDRSCGPKTTNLSRF